MICPNCKANNDDNQKFCGECGTRLPEPKKHCPKCNAEWPMEQKFCGECGYNFTTNNKKSTTEGVSMGDKNVIAGDVIGKKETYNITGNATIVHNEDETKKTSKCHICGSVVQRINGYDCPDCGHFTCEDCFDKKEGTCKECVEKNIKNKEQQYKLKVIEYLGNDNRIDAAEFSSLTNLAESLGISSFRAMELQDEVKNNSRNKNGFTSFEKLNYEKAMDLFYDEGMAEDALELLNPIYKSHKEDEKVLDLFLPVLAAIDENKAKSIISGLNFDSLGAFLTKIEISLREQNMAEAERIVQQTSIIWPDNTLVKCHRILYRLALFNHFGKDEWLQKAEELVLELGEAHSRLELSWQVKVQCMISEAQGNEPFEMDREFCKQNQLYYNFMQYKPGYFKENKKLSLIQNFINESVSEDNGKILIKYNGNSQNVIIPNSVCQIAGSAFEGCESVIKIEIPDSVIKIGDRAFMNCTSLTDIQIPNSVTAIGSWAFYGCKLLSSTSRKSICKHGYNI